MKGLRNNLPCLAVATIVALMFIISLTGLPNLADNERRIAEYIRDIVQNSNWLCQCDAAGDIASKPPAYSWLAALASLPFEHLNRFTLYFPSALGTVATAVLIVVIGRKQFGQTAGLLAGLAYVLSPMADKQLNMARYDALFAFPVTLGTWFAFRAWQQGRGWTLFWLAGAAATMVKGPLGVFLAASGLLAALWEWRSRHALPIRGNHLPGIGLFLLICGGWLFLAWLQMGQPVLDKLIGRELVGHALGEKSSGPGFYKPVQNFLVVFAPWSLAACVAFWRILRQPSAQPEERRFERFLFCQIAAGLVTFSMAGHQRDRLIFPLIPAAALLAGREMARWLATWPLRRIYRMSAAAAVMGLAGIFIYHHLILGTHRDVQRSVAMREMAAHLEREMPTGSFLCVDTPFALTHYLGGRARHVSLDEAARVLGATDRAVVGIRNLGALRERAKGVALHEVARWPAKGDAYVTVVSNSPHTGARVSSL
jgi:4-amino-4-deoxy-L-arabinose transferase-like glycosyltransferase